MSDEIERIVQEGRFLLSKYPLDPFKSIVLNVKVNGISTAVSVLNRPFGPYEGYLTGNVLINKF